MHTDGTYITNKVFNKVLEAPVANNFTFLCFGLYKYKLNKSIG